ncbi:hypothetical protein BMS3Abin04_00109 [bacterium BMS3Abin04]|nr:hypothetical protein BMS3Abin04_00109 [bacterium BMS3Abin04]
MWEQDKIKIESIFRNSNSSDELFDALITSLDHNLSDIDLYKILLANPTLSKDEIIMFTEKLGKEFKKYSSDLYLWTANIFENNCEDYEYLEQAVQYYKKAGLANPTDETPYLNLLNLYNSDFETPANKQILNIIDEGIDKVKKKSKVYFALADHYKKAGNINLQKKYLSLAEKSARLENQ